MKPKISIINYGMGNIYSIKCALDSIGIESFLTDDIDYIKKTDGLILPGVGAFPEAIKKLKEKSIPLIIEKFKEQNKLIIGVCLGMQLLFDKSYEFSENKGLSILEGKVVKFKSNTLNVGWKKVYTNKSNYFKDNPLNKVLNSKFMYFIHSFHVLPKNKNIISSKSSFKNQKFVSSINYKNIYGFQFHPEKSGDNGVGIYKEIMHKVFG
jgi:glutamine amidotransferase